MHCEFRGLAIECVKKSQVRLVDPLTPHLKKQRLLICAQVALSLAERQANRVDPFKQGFSHGADDLDLMSVRLCFQVSWPSIGRPPPSILPTCRLGLRSDCEAVRQSMPSQRAFDQEMKS